MSINRIPSIKYTEVYTDENNNGEGARIPIIIGSSKNTVSTQEIKKYTSWEEINKPKSEGGLGEYTGVIGTDGELLTFLHDFYEEAVVEDSEEIGVPYIYVIDLGSSPTKANIEASMDLAKSVKGVDIEVYCGLTKSNLSSLMKTCNDKIIIESEKGDIRTAIFTATDVATDNELIGLNNSDVQKSRIFLCEPLLFGKTCARICVTPYDVEVGYLEYRSVVEGTFKERSSAEELALQNGGIIFNHDEKTFKKTYCRINLGVSTAFGKTASERPNDALLHSRFNADHTIKRCIAEIYPQLKRNETATNIVRSQTLVDAVVDDEIEKGAMMEGSKVKVKESESNAYVFTLESQLIPVNHTNNIDLTVYVGQPRTVVREE